MELVGLSDDCLDPTALLLDGPQHRVTTLLGLVEDVLAVPHGALAHLRGVGVRGLPDGRRLRLRLLEDLTLCIGGLEPH